jgi:subtilisin family serine protease
MRRALILVFCIASTLTATGRATADPAVIGRLGLVAAGHLPADALGTGTHDGRALLTVRIPGGSAALRRAGFDAQALTSDIAQLRITADELRRLVAQPNVVALEERRILRPLLDASTTAVGAPTARAETGIDGTGVFIGIVDTGVDFRHADLRHADGTSRVAAILDFAHPRGDLHPELFDYNGGAIWLQPDIDATLAAEAAGAQPAIPVEEHDTNGHGTHVSGITASNGRATARGLPAGRYVGMAPGAELIAIQGTHGDATFTDTDVIAGCRFAIEYAGSLGRPVVVNLSLGSNAGPHDGTSALEIALDELFPGDRRSSAVVVASGNEGNRDQHAAGWALGTSVSVAAISPSSNQSDAQLAFEIWHTGSFAITVVSPSGKRFGPAKPSALYNGPASKEGMVLIDNGSMPGARADARKPASVAIVGPAGGAPAAGTWTLVFEGQASRWDVWITDQPEASTSARFSDHVSEDGRLDMPATAHNAIVTGSFVTKNTWTTVDETMVTRPSVLGTPSTFSSSGPTADGRFAPDVLAPGEYIVSTLSQDALPDNPSSAFFVGPASHLTWADDGLHGVLRGTSQAAPHVAGAIALLFQADPTLTPDALREILRVTARDEGRGYTPRFGFGDLDVLAALRFVRGARGAVVSATASSVGVSRDVVPPGDDVTIVTVTPRADDGLPLGSGRQVTISATAGEPLGDVVDLGLGRYERSFIAHAPRGSTATISATVDGIALASHPAVYIVESRADIGSPFAAGGGCSLGPGAATQSPLTSLAAALLALFLRKSRRGGLPRTLGS